MISREALEAVLEPLYPGQTPLRFEGTSCYRSRRERPHWHFVTFGESDQITLRVPCLADAPPDWPVALLRSLGPPVLYGHQPLASPVPEPGCLLDHAVFAFDPELGEVEDTAFLQAIGITADEAEAIERWSPRGMLDLLRERSQLWITDPYRKSILRDPIARRRVDEASRRGGL